MPVRAVSDFFVRFLFAVEARYPLLLDFINAVLDDSGFPKIISIEVINPFNLKFYQEDKESIVDIKATDENDRKLNIEIQISGDQSYLKRTLYYWARNYQSQIEEGKDYRSLKPVICINLLAFNLFRELDIPHSCFLAMEKDNPEFILTPEFQIHILEILKFKLLKTSRNLTRLQKWVYFFLYAHEIEEDSKEMTYLLKDDPIISEAVTAYHTFTRDRELMEQYEARMKRLSDEATRIGIAHDEGKDEGWKEGKDEGWKEGKDEGWKEGRDAGLKEGRDAGLKEGRDAALKEATRATAQKMKMAGADTAFIMKITGLSADEIGTL